MDVVYRKDQVLVGWKDSNAVYVASNKHDASNKEFCKRYSRVEHKELNIPVPKLIQARLNTLSYQRIITSHA